MFYLISNGSPACKSVEMFLKTQGVDFKTMSSDTLTMAVDDVYPQLLFKGNGENDILFGYEPSEIKKFIDKHK